MTILFPSDSFKTFCLPIYYSIHVICEHTISMNSQFAIRGGKPHSNPWPSILNLILVKGQSNLAQGQGHLLSKVSQFTNMLVKSLSTNIWTNMRTLDQDVDWSWIVSVGLPKNDHVFPFVALKTWVSLHEVCQTCQTSPVKMINIQQRATVKFS